MFEREDGAGTVNKVFQNNPETTIEMKVNPMRQRQRQTELFIYNTNDRRSQLKLEETLKWDNVLGFESGGSLKWLSSIKQNHMLFPWTEAQ